MPIDLAKPAENERSAGYTIEEREGFHRLLNMGFVDTFRYLHPDTKKYSWWSQRIKTAKKNNVGWRIDYFLVSDDLKDKIIEADILDTGDRPDHAPIVLTLDLYS